MTVLLKENKQYKREDDLKFNQGIFKLYDPRIPITSAKQYNNALNAYRKEIADPSVAGKKYLQDVESAYAQRINELTDTNRLDRLYLVDQNDDTNYINFQLLDNAIRRSTLDIKEETTGKLIRKKQQKLKQNQ